MIPLRVDDDGTAVFTTDQIDDYGFPDDKIYPKYYVIESPPKMLMSFVHEQQTQYRKIHRYDRDARFRTVVRNLLGDSKSVICKDFLIIVKAYMDQQQGVGKFEGCRSIVRHFKKPKYYTLIPTMIIKMGYPPLLKVPSSVDVIIRRVFIHYKAFEQQFFQMQTCKKYFPNMKFLALTLLELNGVNIDEIPKLRTSRKLKAMEKIFIEINNLLVHLDK
jgi:hypothetical protein